MKYFTRKRYQAIQQDSRTAERDWKKASTDYARRLRAIRDDLPESSRQLCELTFHDGVVRSVRRLANGSAVVVVDATNNPFGPRGQFELVFTGVRTLTMRGTVVGDWFAAAAALALARPAQLKPGTLGGRGSDRVALDSDRIAVGTHGQRVQGTGHSLRGVLR